MELDVVYAGTGSLVVLVEAGGYGNSPEGPTMELRNPGVVEVVLAGAVEF
jgi:hypothetical protein